MACGRIWHSTQYSPAKAHQKSGLNLPAELQSKPNSPKTFGRLNNLIGVVEASALPHLFSLYPLPVMAKHYGGSAN